MAKEKKNEIKIEWSEQLEETIKLVQEMNDILIKLDEVYKKIKAKLK